MSREPKNEPKAPLPLEPVEMLAAIGPVARSSVVDAVADRLRGEILAGRLQPGTRLPSERELSLALGVNRLTLRAALGRLEETGLVETKHGAGTIVTSWRERAGLDALASLFGSLDPGGQAWLDLAVSLLEVRRILATEAIALAAARRTEEDLETMRRLAAEQATRVHDPVIFARGEFALERAIIRATGNVGLELVLNTFARFPDEHPAIIAALYDEREHAPSFHALIIEMIRRGDADEARATMRRAFEAMDEQWVRRHQPRSTARSQAQVQPAKSPPNVKKSRKKRSKR